MTDAGDDRASWPRSGHDVLDALRRTWDAARAPSRCPCWPPGSRPRPTSRRGRQPPEVVAGTWIELQGDEARLEELRAARPAGAAHVPELYALLAGQHAPALAWSAAMRSRSRQEWLDEPVARSADIDPDRRLVRLVLDDLVEAERRVRRAAAAAALVLAATAQPLAEARAPQAVPLRRLAGQSIMTGFSGTTVPASLLQRVRLGRGRRDHPVRRQRPQPGLRSRRWRASCRPRRRPAATRRS